MDRNVRVLVVLAASIAAAMLTSDFGGSQGAAADFELAMVIKETTNPYYNATLAGAKIAAEEIGGTAKNYGPTQSSAQAQIEIINNLAERRVPALPARPHHPHPGRAAL